MTADVGLGAAAIGLGVGLRLQRIDFGERTDYRFGIKSEYSVLKIGRLQQYFVLSAYLAHQSLDDRIKSSDLGVGGEIGVGLQFRLFGDISAFGETGFGATFWKQAEDLDDEAEHHGSVMFGLKGRF